MSGMTLRDYFIAHAPSDPQPWFTPVMPLKPVLPAYPFVGEENEALDREYRSWQGMDLEDISAADEVSPRVVEHMKELHAYRLVLDEWEKLRLREFYLQWPAAWADEMLKRRDS